MGREIKYGLLAVLFFIVVAAVVWDRLNIQKGVLPGEIKSTPAAAVRDDGDIIEFSIGGNAPLLPGRKKENPAVKEPGFEIVDEPSPSDSPPQGQTPPTSEKKEQNPNLRRHTVSEGDSLSKIAYQYYGKASKWQVIARFNKIENPKNLRVGKTLLIPLSKEVPARRGNGTPKEISQPPLEKRGREYRVEKSDTLYSIALKKLGDGKKWEKIAALNGITDPGKLKPGTIIILP